MSEDDARAFGLPTDAKSRSLFVRLDARSRTTMPYRRRVVPENAVHVLDNGEHVPAAEPWMPPEAKAASQFDLAALVEAIKRGSPTPAANHTRQRCPNPRSIRQLLVTHGFHSADAQKACMSRLMNECDVKSAQFKSSTPQNTGRRSTRGLRAGGSVARGG